MTYHCYILDIGIRGKISGLDNFITVNAISSMDDVNLYLNGILFTSHWNRLE